MSNFEVIFQITIKYLRHNDNTDPVRYALYSLGLDDIAIKIYEALTQTNIATPEDLSKKLSLDLDTVIDRLDQMYSLGLIDKLGRAYIRDQELSQAIRTRVKRRIENLLEFIAKIAEGLKNE